MSKMCKLSEKCTEKEGYVHSWKNDVGNGYCCCCSGAFYVWLVL